MRTLPREARKEKALKSLFHWVLILFVFSVDRLIKAQVLQRFEESQTVPVWPGVVHLTRVNNTGAAFGLLRDAAPALAVFSALSALLIALYLAGLFGKPVRRAGAWALVAGGALGNLYDRVTLGYVLDYLDLRVWPVFNFADTCILAGVSWILWSVVLRKPGRGPTHVSGPV